ncbi:Ig-like domain-containing protein [Clostridium sp. OM05-9]|uniref:Ig-like domain-containing protein n=1 Tax=Clostridium sp. OM05-9 TaxID=2293045 RepID=UPI0015FBB59B|nr:Ig-like domain-containing protein [Clostridium sp. OM05-9]
MKKHAKTSVLKRILAVVIAVTVAVSIFTVPDAEVSAATGKVKSVAVTNLPAKQLTLKKGKTFTLKSKVTVTRKASKKVTYKTSNKKIATVNAKGKITAKKKGTAKIYVISKADKKKKCTVTVTVGTPVTKVKLNKTKSTMTIGKKQTLKATVTPKKASSKAVVWKSSNKKVATVTSKGVVKAKKAGTATITATAKDGSGKKATCKVTVKKASAAKPADPTPAAPDYAIKSMKVLGVESIEITFSKAVVLTKADFEIFAKQYSYGTYKKPYQVVQAETSDHITYILHINDEDEFQKNTYIKVAVKTSGVYKECIYRDKTVNIQKTRYYAIKVNGALESYNDDLTYGTGYRTYSIDKLPVGMDYYILNDMIDESIVFTGSPTEAGETQSLLTCEDELGNKYQTTIIWMIYDENQLYSRSTTCQYFSRENGVYHKPYSVYGGSGQYTYELAGGDYELFQTTISTSGYMRVSFENVDAGEYQIQVKITDKNNPALYTVATITYTIIDGAHISAIVRDANGDPIRRGNYSLHGYSDDPSQKLNSTSGSIQDGTMSYTIIPGNYNITFYNASHTAKYTFYNQKCPVNSGDEPMTFDVTLPVYPVTIVPDPEKSTATSFGYWVDVNGANAYGYESGDTLYLPNGTYYIKTEDGKSYARFTVNGKSLTVNAYDRQ